MNKKNLQQKTNSIFLRFDKYKYKIIKQNQTQSISIQDLNILGKPVYHYLNRIDNFQYDIQRYYNGAYSEYLEDQYWLLLRYSKNLFQFYFSFEDYYEYFLNNSFIGNYLEEQIIK